MTAPADPTVVDRALHIVSEGGTYEEAATAVGVAKASVGRWARKRDVPRLQRGRRKGQTWAKPRPKQARMVELRRQGLTLDVIAERVGRSRDAVVRSLRRWLPRLKAQG